MQMAWSANARYGASRSASLKTATTSMPRSRQARMTRRAISPRLATRMRWNMEGGQQSVVDSPRPSSRRIRVPDYLLAGRVHVEQHRIVLDRLPVGDE